MLGDQSPRHVVFPKRLGERADDEEHLNRLVVEYIMVRYPDYRVINIKDGFAICNKNY
ncbi:hypothetical protein [Peribacillus loiseleuriae]|uniref:hypothetical protein n=1 Tax=Peribacillus loiseleuriae TaxID=1679170 RepID=UPI000AA268A4|nr:hypothetical protein [Peribacillus loiseleuriae]